MRSNSEAQEKEISSHLEKSGESLDACFLMLRVEISRAARSISPVACD